MPPRLRSTAISLRCWPTVRPATRLMNARIRPMIGTLKAYSKMVSRVAAFSYFSKRLDWGYRKLEAGQERGGLLADRIGAVQQRGRHRPVLTPEPSSTRYQRAT